MVSDGRGKIHYFFNFLFAHFRIPFFQFLFCLERIANFDLIKMSEMAHEPVRFPYFGKLSKEYTRSFLLTLAPTFFKLKKQVSTSRQKFFESVSIFICFQPGFRCLRLFLFFTSFFTFSFSLSFLRFFLFTFLPFCR